MTGDCRLAWIPALTALCQEAGAVILSYYGRKERLDTRHKDNNTPLTAADIAVHHLLAQGLPRIADYPVVSEENAASHHRQDGTYWLIDPIDGTSEFIRQSGQFCILIALIHDHRPVLAMIYAPIGDECWYAVSGAGSYKRHADGLETRLYCRMAPNPPTIITHNFPQSQRMQGFMDGTFGAGYLHLRRGSALKFCAIAEGQADIYPKIVAKTSEWDIAAGDLLVHEAGGGIRLFDGSVPRYGLSGNLVNPPFLAYSRLDSQREQEYLHALAALVGSAADAR